jgi:7-cyano-7-deazaguanine synthase
MVSMTLEALSTGDRPLAVLVSGGLDSAVLLAEAAESRRLAQPIYIRAGTYWEETELCYLRRFLSSMPSSRMGNLVELRVPVGDLYGDHWSLSGEQVPGADSPDEAVYLPGRNVLLLGKAMIWCHLHGIAELALASLAANPFPDATPTFFSSLQEVVNQAICGKVRIIWPYLGLSKSDVIRRGSRFPLEHTFSCMRPRNGGRHCGQCNKCAERQRAFMEAGVADPTPYDNA